MRLPIRDQILWPLLGLLLVAVAANAVFSAWWISTRIRTEVGARQRQIIGMLEESTFPLSSNVMENLQKLTGNELILWDSVEGRIVASTSNFQNVSDRELMWDAGLIDKTEPERRDIRGTTYAVRAGRIRRNPSQQLLIFTSEESLRKVSREVIWPPIAVGFATIVLLIPLTLLLASIWGQRIRSIERQVESIAQGDFGMLMSAGAIDDELSRLVDSINSMSRQLGSLREQLIQGERTRLVAQLTAGFAHQLRNGLAGAKLAIQLHESRCSASESSLVIARNQLALVEEEIQGLLSLGKAELGDPLPVDLTQLVTAIEGLVSPVCEHKGVELNVEIEGQVLPVMGFANGLRAAILNLVQNAIDAAGPEGNVWLRLNSCGNQNTLMVEDDGNGPPANLAGSIFHSFVTSKPEGVGLGLTVAATVANTHHGSLTWSRVNERTRFELVLPNTSVTKESHDS